ncbi:hypothetical protein niasHT_010470 [Heterodera trifolii]|uniref:BTB domain-containing protein n=1 Tax=Heterodera trifolii TaxID=157864 RepID=A0ABD2ME01_9BILA
MSSSSSNPATLADRMKVLLSTAKGSDIQFLLFQAHKSILMSASDVFEAMFPPSADCEQLNPVEIPDVEVGAFKVMLSFIYTDDLSELDGENAMAVLYAAFAQARLLNLEDFAQRCMRYICQNAGLLLGTDDFLQIDQNLLCELFGRDHLAISNEFEIWKAALRWADQKCRQNAIECSAENRRAALGPALFKIHFSHISLEALRKEIVPSGVLSKDEVIGVYQFHWHPNFHGLPGQYPLKFPYKARIVTGTFPRATEGQLCWKLKNYRNLHEKKWEVAEKKDNYGTKKCLGFYLLSTASEEATLRIVSQKSGTEDLIGKFNNRVFNNKRPVKGFSNFITFSELMDPKRGFYDKNEDKVTLAIDVFVEEETVEKLDSNPNKSSGKIAELENAITGAHNCVRTSCHEAGHGTKIWLDPDNADYFRPSVIAEDESEGATHYVIAEHPTKDQLMARLRQKVVVASFDHDVNRQMVTRSPLHAVIDEIMNEAKQGARAFILENLESVRKVAIELNAMKVIRREKMEELLGPQVAGGQLNDEMKERRKNSSRNRMMNEEGKREGMGNCFFRMVHLLAICIVHLC